MQIQRLGLNPFFCINVCIAIEKMFDGGTNADVKCEQALIMCSHSPTLKPILRAIKYGLCEIVWSVRTTQRQTRTKTPIGFCTHFIDTYVGVCVSVGQSEYTCGRVIHSLQRRTRK